MENVGNQTLNQRDIDKYISNLQNRMFDERIIEQTKDDLEYGLSLEQVEIYLEKKLSIGQVQQISRALKSDIDEQFLKQLVEEQFSEKQMGVILDFAEKGITSESISGSITKDMKPHAIHKALKPVEEKLNEIQERKEEAQEAANANQSDVDETKAQEIMEKISDIVSEFGSNKKFLDQVMKKLEQMDSMQQSMDDVRVELAKKLEAKEALIEEQQTMINKQASEMAVLRNKCASFGEEKETFLKEKELFQKEKEEFRKEKEGMKRKMNEMGNQIADLSKPNIKVPNQQNMSSSSNQKEHSMPEHYQAVVTDHSGARHIVQVERSGRKNKDGLFALAGKKFFKGKSRVNLIQHLKNASLNQSQMQQVKVAIESGLMEEEVIDIINSGFSAEEMAQAIEIVLAEKMYGGVD